VQSLPLVVSLIVAALVGGPLVRSLRDGGFVRQNYRGTELPFPIGVLIPVAALVALVPLALLQYVADVDVFEVDTYPAVTYVIGVALLGLLDDFAGSGVFGNRPSGASPRGWRGHGGAIFTGGFSTGAVKAVGSLGLALFIAPTDGSKWEYLLAAGVLVLATNLFNLLDLRPGRSIKALVLLGAALTIGSTDVDSLWALGLFLGPILILLPLDLRERGMLGDTGSNAIGAVAGIWLIATLDTTGQAIALGVMAVLTLYGEFRSISGFIERTPGLRHLDSLGRPTHA
jgi:UDP-GlcNAc:undecaprenyl-phosphate GlcNAc-1-phosphate transferase